MAEGARELFTRFVAAMNRRDFASLEALVHPEFEAYFPQSRERSRGFAAFRAQLEQYPGDLPEGAADEQGTMMFGGEDRWVITPGYTVLPLTGPEYYTAAVKTRYPDGSNWHVITIFETREGKLYRSHTYFAPEFEQPEWRKGLTEVD